MFPVAKTIKIKIQLTIYFPQKKMKKKWLIKLKMNYERPHFKVCSQHFTTTDFKPTHPYVLKRFLKPHAVPTLNLPVRSTGLKLNKQLSQERLNRINRREIKKRKKQISMVQNENDMNSCNAMLQGENDQNPWNAEEQNNLIDAFNDDTAVIDDQPSDLIVATSSNWKSVSVRTGSVMTCNAEVQVNLDAPRFTIVQALTTNESLNAYTGIHSIKLLQAIVECLDESYSDRKNSRFNMKLTNKECVILTLMKIKLNMSYTCLLVLFQVCPNTCKNSFSQTVNDLEVIFRPMIRWPEKDEILKNMPISFSKFSSTVIVLDCTEVKMESTKCLKCRIRTYSYYKGGNTAKFLLGVTPSGLISYISSGFGGRASDKQIFNESNILDLTIPGIDSIMVDKDFMIEEECALCGVKLIRPPFCKKKKLTAAEADSTSEIAGARIQVERVIQRLKQFTILHGPVPHNLVKILDSVMIIICGIVNLSAPTLAADKFLPKENIQ